MKVHPAGVLLLYPVVAHLAIEWQLPQVIAVYLVLLSGFQGILALHRKRRWQAGLWMSLPLFLLVLFWQEAVFLLIYLPPLMLTAGMALLFADSLRPQCAPLITRFAEQIDGMPLSEDKQQYTRQVTQIWALFLGLMLIELAGLAVFASASLWSWFANIVNYLLLGALLVGEFAYRRRRFGREETGSLLGFFHGLAEFRHTGMRSWS